MECFILLGMPIIPVKPCHVFNEEGVVLRRFQTISLRWSWGLVGRVYLLYWMIPAMVAGVLTAIIAGFGGGNSPRGDESHIPIVLGGLGVSLACGLAYWAMWAGDRRNRRIRHTLGAQTIGTSDPAMWTKKRLQEFGWPEQLFGTATFADAVPSLLEQGAFDSAMLAARLTMALENRDAGERLTSEVLKQSVNAKEREVGPI